MAETQGFNVGNYDFNPLFSESWNYQVPNDPWQRVYDFYTLGLLDPSAMDVSIASPLRWIPEDRRERAMANINEAKEALYSQMQHDYKNDLRFSVSAEMRHVLDGMSGLTSGHADFLRNSVMPKVTDFAKLKSEAKAVQDRLHQLRSAAVPEGVPEVNASIERQINTYMAKEAELAKKMQSVRDMYLSFTSHPRWPKQKSMSTDDAKIYRTTELVKMADLVLSFSPEQWNDIIAKFQAYSNAIFGSKPVPAAPDRYASCSPQYVYSYMQLREAGIDDRELAALGTVFFLLPPWSGSYGSVPWAVIARTYGWISSIPEDNLRDLSLAIDASHNLQHNTGSAFNKVSTVYGNGKQFKEILDFKFEATPLDILEGDTSSGNEWMKPSALLRQAGEILIPLAEGQTKKTMQLVHVLTSRINSASTGDGSWGCKVLREFKEGVIQPAPGVKSPTEPVGITELMQAIKFMPYQIGGMSHDDMWTCIMQNPAVSGREIDACYSIEEDRFADRQNLIPRVVAFGKPKNPMAMLEFVRTKANEYPSLAVRLAQNPSLSADIYYLLFDDFDNNGVHQGVRALSKNPAMKTLSPATDPLVEITEYYPYPDEQADTAAEDAPQDGWSADGTTDYDDLLTIFTDLRDFIIDNTAIKPEPYADDNGTRIGLRLFDTAGQFIGEAYGQTDRGSIWINDKAGKKILYGKTLTNDLRLWVKDVDAREDAAIDGPNDPHAMSSKSAPVKSPAKKDMLPDLVPFTGQVPKPSPLKPGSSTADKFATLLYNRAVDRHVWPGGDSHKLIHVDGKTVTVKLPNETVAKLDGGYGVVLETKSYLGSASTHIGTHEAAAKEAVDRSDLNSEYWKPLWESVDNRLQKMNLWSTIYPRLSPNGSSIEFMYGHQWLVRISFNNGMLSVGRAVKDSKNNKFVSTTPAPIASVSDEAVTGAIATTYGEITGTQPQGVPSTPAVTTPETPPVPPAVPKATPDAPQPATSVVSPADPEEIKQLDSMVIKACSAAGLSFKKPSKKLTALITGSGLGIKYYLANKVKAWIPGTNGHFVVTSKVVWDKYTISTNPTVSYAVQEVLDRATLSSNYWKSFRDELSKAVYAAIGTKMTADSFSMFPDSDGSLSVAQSGEAIYNIYFQDDSLYISDGNSSSDLGFNINGGTVDKVVKLMLPTLEKGLQNVPETSSPAQTIQQPATSETNDINESDWADLAQDKGTTATIEKLNQAVHDIAKKVSQIVGKPPEKIYTLLPSNENSVKAKFDLPNRITLVLKSTDLGINVQLSSSVNQKDFDAVTVSVDTAFKEIMNRNSLSSEYFKPLWQYLADAKYNTQDYANLVWVTKIWGTKSEFLGGFEGEKKVAAYFLDGKIHFNSKTALDNGFLGPSAFTVSSVGKESFGTILGKIKLLFETPEPPQELLDNVKRAKAIFPAVADLPNIGKYPKIESAPGNRALLMLDSPNKMVVSVSHAAYSLYPTVAVEGDETTFKSQEKMAAAAVELGTINRFAKVFNATWFDNVLGHGTYEYSIPPTLDRIVVKLQAGLQIEILLVSSMLALRVGELLTSTGIVSKQVIEQWAKLLKEYVHKSQGDGNQSYAKLDAVFTELKSFAHSINFPVENLTYQKFYSHGLYSGAAIKIPLPNPVVVIRMPDDSFIVQPGVTAKGKKGIESPDVFHAAFNCVNASILQSDYWYEFMEAVKSSIGDAPVDIYMQDVIRWSFHKKGSGEKVASIGFENEKLTLTTKEGTVTSMYLGTTQAKAWGKLISDAVPKVIPTSPAEAISSHFEKLSKPLKDIWQTLKSLAIPVGPIKDSPNTADNTLQSFVVLTNYTKETIATVALKTNGRIYVEFIAAAVAQTKIFDPSEGNHVIKEAVEYINQKTIAYSKLIAIKEPALKKAEDFIALAKEIMKSLDASGFGTSAALPPPVPAVAGYFSVFGKSFVTIGTVTVFTTGVVLCKFVDGDDFHVKAQTASGQVIKQVVAAFENKLKELE